MNLDDSVYLAMEQKSVLEFRAPRLGLMEVPRESREFWLSKNTARLMWGFTVKVRERTASASR